MSADRIAEIRRQLRLASVHGGSKTYLTTEAPKDIEWLLEELDWKAQSIKNHREAHKHTMGQRDFLESRVAELEGQLAAVDGWTLTATSRGVMVSHETDADRRVLVADQAESLPVGAVLAFIADTEEATDEV